MAPTSHAPFPGAGPKLKGPTARRVSELVPASNVHFTVVKKVLDLTAAIVSVIFILNIPFVFRDYFFLSIKSLFLYIYFLPGLGTLFSALHFG